MTIDLLPFVANKWEVREYLQTPWRDGEWVYATNAHIAVRLPADTYSAAERSEKQPNNLPALFNTWHRNVEGEFLLMPPLPDNKQCPECHGSGQWPDSEDDPEACWRCNGSGFWAEPFDIGDAAFALRYLHLLSKLPQVRIRPNGPHQAAALIFAGGEALLMPCRKD